MISPDSDRQLACAQSLQCDAAKHHTVKSPGRLGNSHLFDLYSTSNIKVPMNKKLL